jgi:hypothetical protein
MAKCTASLRQMYEARQKPRREKNAPRGEGPGGIGREEDRIGMPPDGQRWRGISRKPFMPKPRIPVRCLRKAAWPDWPNPAALAS